jgi:GDPmannose 4,6-dehydratase
MLRRPGGRSRDPNRLHSGHEAPTQWLNPQLSGRWQITGKPTKSSLVPAFSFNHESPLRPERFVTQKIVQAACRIAKGAKEKLTLGNTEIQRDWGWAPEYVEAMFLMLQHPAAEDYVIATGETRKPQDFIEVAFRTVGLDWRQHTATDKGLYRPTEIMIGRVNALKAERKLGWKPKHKTDDVARMMVEAV